MQAFRSIKLPLAHRRKGMEALQILSRRISFKAQPAASESETEFVIGAVPPLMSDMTGNASSSSNGETFLIHEILPQMIQRLLWLIDMNDNGNDNPNGTPSPAAA